MGTIASRSGFTLVEVLIALTIMSMLMLLTNSAFFSMSQSYQRLSESATLTSDLRLLTAFIDNQLSHMRPLAIREQDNLNIYFAGFSDRVRFTGALPAHRGGGGLHFLEINRSSNPPALVIADTAAAKESDFFNDSSIDTWNRTVLSEDIQAIDISYFGTKDNETADWHRDWLNQPRLPELIRFEFDLGSDHEWPPLVVALHTKSVASQPNLVWQ